MTNTRLFAEWVALLMAAFALVLLAYMQDWTARFDLSLLDFANEISLNQPDDRITLVEIDDRSLQEEGVWPWDRSQHAQLIKNADSAGATTIALDILFLEQLSQEGDATLAAAMRDSEKVFVPFTFTNKTDAVDGVTPTYPIEVIHSAAAGSGHVAVFPETDGAIRSFELIHSSPEGDFPHLAKSITDYVLAGQTAAQSTPDQSYIPIHPRGSYPTISASAVLNGNVPDAFLTDKIVIIGATAQGMGDRYAVPAYAGGIMSGVELQANLIDALLNDELIVPMPQMVTLVSLFGFVFCLFFAFWYLAPRHVLVFAFGLILLLTITSIGAAILFHKWLPVGPALLAILLAYPFWGWRRLSSVSRHLEREARRLLNEPALKQDKNIEGFDTVARHLAMLKSLTGKIRADWIFLRAVLDASPDPMLVFNREDKLILMNDRAEGLFSKSGVSMQVDRKKRPTLEEIINKADAQIEHDDEGEALIFKSGKAYLMARSTLDSDVASEIIDLRDVTEQRETERQRQQTLEFLSHDMRSPQVAIIGLSGNAFEEKGDKERFSRIESEARRTLKLADDFVQIARLEYAGLDREDADVAALLHEAVDRAYPQAKSNRIVINTDIPDEPIFATFDPSAVSRAVDNLMGNAIKFSESEGSVLVGLNDVSAGPIEITIADEGPGLPEERINDPFARFGAHNSNAGPSAGLGLAFVEKVVLEHGGTIQVDSAADTGTRFILRLPRN